MSWRTDAKSRDSTAQISDTRPLLSIRNFQRGCVTQMISALRRLSRRAATAGNVCTISPSEPNLTTAKRVSAMRRLANRFQKDARGVIFGISNDGDANTKTSRCGPLGNSICAVVGALRVHVWPQGLQQSFNVWFA